MSSREVSIVVPTYRRAEYLRRCLRSILANPSQQFEVLVSDNASPDDTQAVLASFKDPRLRHWRHDKNIGVERNILSLLKAAQSEWIFCLTDDDYMLDGGLDRIVSVARENPSVGVILSAAKVIDAGGNYLHTYHFHDTTKYFRAGRDALLGLVQASHVLSRIMMRRTWMDLAGVEASLGSLYPQMYAVGSILREHEGLYLDECLVAHTTGNATDWDYPRDFMVGSRIRLINHMLRGPKWRSERDALLCQLREEIATYHMPTSLRKSWAAFISHQQSLLKHSEIAFSVQYWRALVRFLITTSLRSVKASSRLPT